MEVHYEQKLTPAGSLLPDGIAITNSRLQCDGNSATLVLKKNSTVKSPNGDSIETSWTKDSVIITITEKTVKETYKAAIFNGTNTVVSQVARLDAGVEDVTLAANFTKEFKDSAPAKVSKTLYRQVSHKRSRVYLHALENNA